MRRSLVALGGAVALAAFGLTAAPAGAHATFATSSVPVNSNQTLTMDVPHEREDNVYNTQVVVAMPVGWQASSCASKATWTCSIGTQSGRQVVKFVKNSGAPRAEDESFTYAVHTASSVGSFAFPTLQTYSTGETVSWIGDPSAPEPAPVLRTYEGAPPPTVAPTTVPPHGSPSVTAAPGGGSTPTTSTGSGGPATTGDPATPATDPLTGETVVPNPDTSTTSPGVDDTTPDGEGAAVQASEAAAVTTASESKSSNGLLLIPIAFLVAVALSGGFLIWRRNNSADDEQT